MEIEYTLNDAREFLRVAYDNCRAPDLNLPFAIFSAYKAQKIFNGYNMTSLIEESEAIINIARREIRRKTKLQS
ncbi:MAG: hypothetical protein Q8R00_00110 [Candidatus Nanoarchaeia archaeon]|nr:hypothetical protein [Candidatus Nanoarchaeia archaeon]